MVKCGVDAAFGGANGEVFLRVLPRRNPVVYRENGCGNAKGIP
jgi:hypothetical protein